MERSKKRRGSDVGGFTQKSRKVGAGGPRLQGNLKTAVKKQIRQEMEAKYFDHDASGAVTTGANWNSTILDANVFVPDLGDNTDQRQGRKVTIHKIKIRGHVKVPKQDAVATTTAEDATQVRIVMAFDHESAGTASPGNFVIRNPGSSSNELAHIQPQNIDHAGQFRVIWDENFVLQNPNPIAVGTLGASIDQFGLVVPFEKTIRFKTPVEVVFYKVTTTGDYRDVLSNNLLIWHHASDVSLTPQTYLTTRCYYKDVGK